MQDSLDCIHREMILLWKVHVVLMFIALTYEVTAIFAFKAAEGQIRMYFCGNQYAVDKLNLYWTQNCPFRNEACIFWIQTYSRMPINSLHLFSMILFVRYVVVLCLWGLCFVSCHTSFWVSLKPLSAIRDCQVNSLFMDSSTTLISSSPLRSTKD